MVAVGVDADLVRALENERALNAILRSVVREGELETLLEECLDILLSVSWLSILPKGGIFLADEGQRELRLVAQRDLAPPLLTVCARVPFGHCLCGRAAQERRIQHAACVDHRHEIRYPGIRPHGHYNVPILDGDRVLGVILLYLPDGHPPHPAELAFLESVADILSLVIRHRRAVDELERVCRELTVLACTDPLTGLYNRRHFFERLQAAWAEAERHDRPLAVALFDLDHFKRINDTWGHATGDRVLETVARVVRRECRHYDVAARLGGEEFALLLPGAGAREAVAMCERLRRRLAATTVPVEGEDGIRFTASFGVACRRRAVDVHDLMRRCDRALYRAKAEGRDRVATA